MQTASTPYFTSTTLLVSYDMHILIAYLQMHILMLFQSISFYLQNILLDVNSTRNLQNTVYITRSL